MSSHIGNINRLVPGLLDRLDASRSAKNQSEVENKSSFTELFSNLLSSVDGLQKDASQIQEALMVGEPVELHQVMIKAQEAGIAMDLLLEIRNKLLTAYNELMRMPI